MADDSTKLIIVLEAQSRKLQNSLVQVNKQIDRFAAQTERRFELMNKKNAASFDKLSQQMKGSIGGLQNLLGPLIGTLGAREVIQFADAWAVAGNKIAAAGQVAQIVPRSLEELKDSANATRTSLESYVDLYARLLRSSTAVAASELDVARATDIVAKSLKAGGASAQEQQAALIQLGQALGSGILQGDELRSLRENAPLIARAIAKEFGVTIGELKALGAEGKLTSDRVFKAILAGGADIDAAFAATKSTITDAFTVISNEFTAYIGTAGGASGATKGLIDALNYLANNFQQVGDAVVVFALVLTTALAGKAIGAVVVGLGQAIIALATFLNALRAGTLTVAVFSAAMGPIAIIASAAAVAIGLLVYQQGEAARVAAAHAAALDQNAAAIDVAKDASAEYRESLKRQIELQIKAAESAITNAQAQLEQTDKMARAAAAATILWGAMGGADPVKRQAAADGVYNSMIGGAQGSLEEQKKNLEALKNQLEQLTDLGPGTSGVGGSGSGSGSGGKENEYQKKLKSVIDQTEMTLKLTEAQRGLNPLVEDYGYAVEKARVAEELRVAAMEAGVAMTPEVRAAIDLVAEGYAGATVEAKKLAEEQDKTREKMESYFASAKEVTRGFVDDLLAGKTAAEAFGNALNNVADKLMDAAFDGLFGGGKGDFGLVGKLFGFADGGIASHGKPKMFANGGVSNSAAVFGEAGPEAAVPLPDGRRIPVDLRMPKAGGNSDRIDVAVSVGVQNGSLVPLIVEVSGQVAGKTVDQRTPAIVRAVAPGAIKDASRNRDPRLKG